MAKKKGGKKGGKKKGGGVKAKSQKQLKREAELRELQKLRGLTGATDPKKMVEIIPQPEKPEGVKEGTIGGKGHFRRKFKSLGSFVVFDQIAVENTLIKWRPIEVNNPILKIIAVLGLGKEEGEGNTRQLLWEKPTWMKYLRRYNCFIIMDQAPDLLTGEPIDQKFPPPLPRRIEEGKREKRLKKHLYQALNIQRLEPVATIIFDLPDQIWQLHQPELFAIGLDCYALFGDLQVGIKQGQQTNNPSSATQSGPGGNIKSWEQEQAELFAKIASEEQVESTRIPENDNLDDLILQSNESLPVVRTEPKTVYTNKDLQAIIDETNCTLDQAQQALTKCNGDLVNAILELS